MEIPAALGARFGLVSEAAPKGVVIPDALLQLRWRRWGVQGAPRSVAIYVEAEQLAQQWSVLSAHPHPGEERWLLLVNKTPGVPWPDGARPELWPGEGRAEMRRSLRGWSALRTHYHRTGQPPAGSDQLPADAWPRLLHLSWQRIADLTRALEGRSWAYRDLFRGLREYLGSAGYHAPLRHLDVVETGAARPIPRRDFRAGHQRPVLFDTHPSHLFRGDLPSPGAAP